MVNIGLIGSLCGVLGTNVADGTDNGIQDSVDCPIFPVHGNGVVLRHRRLKRQQDIDILNADIGKIGDDEAARRARKYQNR
jgi:hypothetical protein